MRQNITVGSDVEFFLNHRHSGTIPATRMNTPGTKLQPVPLGDGTFHRDNISVEIQPPPATTPQEFIDNNLEMRNHLSRIYEPMEIGLQTAAVAEFTEEMVELQEAKEIGCEPDVCAYSGETMQPTNGAAMNLMRTASGHIHIGDVDDLSEALRQEVVKHLDHIEGPSLMVEDVDMDHLAQYRRRYYGQAGRYRLKPYGLEWRTPSCLNWYTWVHRARAPRLFGSIYAAIGMVDAGIFVEHVMSRADTDTTRIYIDGSHYEAMIEGHMRHLSGLYQANTVAWNIIAEAGEKYDYPPIFAE